MTCTPVWSGNEEGLGEELWINSIGFENEDGLQSAESLIKICFLQRFALLNTSGEMKYSLCQKVSYRDL